MAVTPLSPEELEAVIVEPAQSVGADFEPGLVARIMTDTADQPGSLALLEYALTLAFDHRVADGADAARFVSELVRQLSDPNLLLLET